MGKQKSGGKNAKGSAGEAGSNGSGGSSALKGASQVWPPGCFHRLLPPWREYIPSLQVKVRHILCEKHSKVKWSLRIWNCSPLFYLSPSNYLALHLPTGAGGTSQGAGGRAVCTGSRSSMEELPCCRSQFCCRRSCYASHRGTAQVAPTCFYALNMILGHSTAGGHGLQRGQGTGWGRPRVEGQGRRGQRVCRCGLCPGRWGGALEASVLSAWGCSADPEARPELLLFFFPCSTQNSPCGRSLATI